MPKLKHAMKRRSRAYTNGERITKKNITTYVCNKAQAIYYVKNKEKISQHKKEWGLVSVSQLRRSKRPFHGGKFKYY